MTILEIEDTLFKIKSVICDDKNLHVTLKTGVTISTPLEWYSRLQKASPEQRNDYYISSFGNGIHWPQIDEDLSVEGILSESFKQREKEIQ